MKNENHPLIQALNRKKDAPSLEGPDFPRHLEVQHSEIPGLPGKKVGEDLTVKVSGVIHSQHNDGHSILQVEKIEPDSSALDEKEFGAKDEIRVIPPNSPEPS